MFRLVITFVFALMVSATAWAGNWNSSSSSSTQEKLQTQNPIAALGGFGVNSMALWSGASRTNPYKLDFLKHYKPLEAFGCATHYWCLVKMNSNLIPPFHGIQT